MKVLHSKVNSDISSKQK